MENLKISSDALFILLGAIMVLAMHAGFAFLELGTVRKKNQVNALVKILADFSVSTIAYFLRRCKFLKLRYQRAFAPPRELQRADAR